MKYKFLAPVYLISVVEISGVLFSFQLADCRAEALSIILISILCSIIVGLDPDHAYGKLRMNLFTVKDHFFYWLLVLMLAVSAGYLICGRAAGQFQVVWMSLCLLQLFISVLFRQMLKRIRRKNTFRI